MLLIVQALNEILQALRARIVTGILNYRKDILLNIRIDIIYELLDRILKGHVEKFRVGFIIIFYGKVEYEVDGFRVISIIPHSVVITLIGLVKFILADRSIVQGHSIE